MYSEEDKAKLDALYDVETGQLKGRIRKVASTKGKFKSNQQPPKKKRKK